jgi:hypothetical protein
MLYSLPIVLENVIKYMIMFVCWGGILFPHMLYSANPTSQAALSIKEVEIDRDAFKPSSGDKLGISFRLSDRAKVSLKIFDFDRDIVATLCEVQMLDKGNHTLLWNGLDQNGKIVPDEAYFFTIEAVQSSERAIYDSTVLSGGIMHEVERIKILPEQQLEYFLPEKGRMHIRAGIVNGPLLAIPVDWEPRPKGLHRERWDGMDQDNLVSVLKHPRYQIRASYFTLPENTIMTVGNKTTSYVQYKLAQDIQKTGKPHLSSPRPKSILNSPLYSAGVLYTKAPPVEVSFPKAQLNEKGIPVVKGNIGVKVDFPEQYRPFLCSKQYEIYFFLDHQFLTEEPWIRLPYETVLDLGEYELGIHVITMNLISPKGQIAIKSKKVLLQ